MSYFEPSTDRSQSTDLNPPPHKLNGIFRLLQFDLDNEDAHTPSSIVSVKCHLRPTMMKQINLQEMPCVRPRARKKESSEDAGFVLG